MNPILEARYANAENHALMLHLLRRGDLDAIDGHAARALGRIAMHRQQMRLDWMAHTYLMSLDRPSPPLPCNPRGAGSELESGGEGRVEEGR